MPLDPSEYDDTTDENVESIVNSINNPQVADDAFDERMSEVEKRLEVAHYYRLLLNDTLFSEATEAGKAVEAEIRVFIKTRLGELMGITAPRGQNHFSDPEVVALKALAAKVIGKPQLVTPIIPQKPRPPTVKKAQIEPAKANKFVPKPVAAAPKGAPPKKGKIKPGPLAEDESFGEGEIIKDEETGKIFKVKDRGDGELFKVELKQTVKNSGAIPTPIGPQATMITESQAARDVNMAGFNTTAESVTSRGTGVLLQAAIQESLKEN